MKKLLHMTLALLPFVLSSQSLSAVVPFDTNEELEIELSNRNNISIDEIAYFTQAADRVFEARDYPGEWEVDFYSGASQSDEGPLLDVQIIRWGTWTPADLECRIYVTVISGGKRHDLGVFRGTADNFTPTIMQREESIVKSAAGALEKVYDRLVADGFIEKAAE